MSDKNKSKQKIDKMIFRNVLDTLDCLLLFRKLSSSINEIDVNELRKSVCETYRITYVEFDRALVDLEKEKLIKISREIINNRFTASVRFTSLGRAYLENIAKIVNLDCLIHFYLFIVFEPGEWFRISSVLY